MCQGITGLPASNSAREVQYMTIGLVSALMKDNDINHQIMVMETYLKQNKDCNMLCFGESFLQGFEGLSWNYEIDKARALGIDSSPIQRIAALARKHDCALSFGFIENDQGSLYSSNLVIGSKGEIVDLYRRISVGWKEPIATAEYKEGDGFHGFEFDGLRFATAICGDLWQDENIKAMRLLHADVILWPLYVDFSVEDWLNHQIADYARQVEPLAAPVFMFNSFVDDVSRANGGCYVFHEGRVTESLDMGQQGILEVDLKLFGLGAAK